MIVTRMLLSQYVDLEDISNDEIALNLNNSGFEVEKISNFYELNQGLVIGKILEIVEVPGSKLSYCTVDINEATTVNVICGASNIAIDQFIIFAKVGATLANGMKIVEKMIKGKLSSGMICSLSEIGVSNQALSDKDKAGVYVFPKNQKYQVGDLEPLKYIFEDDTAFHLELTHNRSDALSVYDLARELGAIFKKTIKPLVKTNILQNKKFINEKIKIELEYDEKLVTALHSMVVELENTKTKSPMWLQSRLRNCNIAPNNLIQDLLTYVTYETGQSLVGLEWDFDQKIIITKNTSPTELNGYEINFDSAVITNGKNVLELLGITTNNEYQIKQTTKRLMILSLNLNDKIMWKQQRKYQRQTPNLVRWAKPSNAHHIRTAILRFLELLTEINAINVIKEVSVINVNKQANMSSKTIIASLQKQQALLGIKDLTSKKIINLLTPLGFVISKEGDSLIITVPDYRVDLINEADISEEIARRYGYNNIISYPPVFVKSEINLNHWKKIQDNIKSYLLSQGIYEAKTYNLVSNHEIEKFNFFNLDKPVQVVNPLSKEHEFLRNNLSGSLLQVLSYNNSHQNFGNKFFEIDDIYHQLSFSHQQLGLVLQGNFLELPYCDRAIPVNFSSIKGLIHSLLLKLNFNDDDIKYQESSFKELHPYLQADILIKNQKIATFGKVNSQLQEDLKLNGENYTAVLNLTLLEQLFNEVIKYNAINKNMFSYLDFSLLINKNTKYENISRIIKNASNKITNLILQNEYFDDQKLGTEFKSLTIRVFFNDKEQQLTDNSLKIEQDNIVKALVNNRITIR